MVLRWQIQVTSPPGLLLFPQRGVGVIPKSVFPHELSDNLGVWGWSLGKEDMEVVDRLETGVRKIVPLITLETGEQKIRDIGDSNYPFGFVEGEEE